MLDSSRYWLRVLTLDDLRTWVTLDGLGSGLESSLVLVVVWVV